MNEWQPSLRASQEYFLALRSGRERFWRSKSKKNKHAAQITMGSLNSQFEVEQHPLNLNHQSPSLSPSSSAAVIAGVAGFAAAIGWGGVTTAAIIFWYFAACGQWHKHFLAAGAEAHPNTGACDWARFCVDNGLGYQSAKGKYQHGVNCE